MIFSLKKDRKNNGSSKIVKVKYFFIILEKFRLYYYHETLILPKSIFFVRF